MTISREQKAGITYISYDDRRARLTINGSTDANYLSDYLYESANPQLLTVNFDGGTDVDAVLLATGANSRKITGQLDQTSGGRSMLWSMTSNFASGWSTINARNIEWLQGPDSQWYSLELVGVYLRANRIFTAVNFSIPGTGSTGNYTLNTINGSASYGASHDIVYALSGPGSEINTGAGNDLVATFYKDVLVDGGDGIDTYVMPEDRMWRFDGLPPAEAASYRFDQSKNALFVSVDFNNSSEWMSVYLRNVERIVYQNKTVTLVIGTEQSEMLTYQNQPFNVMMGLGGNDTISGYGFGDTLLGGDGNDYIKAGDDVVGLTGDLIQNGSFETVQNGVLTGWTSQIRYYPPNAPAYWGNGGTTKLWTQSPGSNSVSGARDGTNFIQLDNDGSVNGITQSVQTVKGKIYTLSFDFAAQRRSNLDTVTVWWNNQQISFVSTKNSRWETFSTTVVGTGGVDVLGFYERPADNRLNGGSGILLDNVRLGVSTLTTILDGGAGRDTLVGSSGIDKFVFHEGDTGATFWDCRCDP